MPAIKYTFDKKAKKEIQEFVENYFFKKDKTEDTYHLIALYNPTKETIPDTSTQSMGIFKLGRIMMSDALYLILEQENCILLIVRGK